MAEDYQLEEQESLRDYIDPLSGMYDDEAELVQEISSEFDPLSSIMTRPDFNILDMIINRQKPKIGDIPGLMTDPFGLGRRGAEDVAEVAKGMAQLGPVAKVFSELSTPGKTQEERLAKEEARLEFLKGVYWELPKEVVKDMVKLLSPKEWWEHPGHTAGRVLFLREILTSIPRVGPKILPKIADILKRGATRGAKAAATGMEKVGVAHKLPTTRVALSEMGGYSADDVVKSFRDATSRSSYIRQYGRKKPVEAIEKAKDARLAEQYVSRATEFSKTQKDQLKNIATTLKTVPEKRHAELFSHWSKKFDISIKDLKEALRTIKSEAGVVIGGKEFRAPWEMTRSEFASEAKGLPAEMYDDIVFNAYKRGMDIPDEVLAPFKEQFTPRPARPGLTPKGGEPLWARGMDRVGEMRGGKYTLSRQHPTDLPKGYLDMEEVFADNWVRYAGPGTFEVGELNPSTIRTMQNLIDIYTPKYGVVVDITGGVGHQGFTVPMWELEQSKTLMNALRKNYPQLLKKRGSSRPDRIPGTGQRVMRKPQEVIDMIVGEEGAKKPTRTILRKAEELLEESALPGPEDIVKLIKKKE